MSVLVNFSPLPTRRKTEAKALSQRPGTISDANTAASQATGSVTTALRS